MKSILKPTKLPMAVGIMGLVSLILRALARWMAVDARGLLPTNHPLVVLMWLVSLAAAVIVIAGVRDLGGGRKYAPNFPASKTAAAGCIVLALCILVTVLGNWEMAGLGLLRSVFGIGAVAGLVVIAICRFRGKMPEFYFHSLVCLFFGVHMVICYRPWSGDPQLFDYFFEVLACVGLMLFAYQQAAFEVGLGKRQTQLLLGLLSGYCALAALPGCGYPVLYIGGGVWALTNLCNLVPPPRRKKVAPEAPRDNAHETA